MNERFMKLTIIGFVIGLLIFLWLGIKVLGHNEVVDPDKTQIDRLPIKPQSILNIITIKQERHVRKSYDKEDCFTDNDLDIFRNSDRLTRIAKNLKANETFQKIANEIAQLPEESWQKLHTQAKATHSMTWEELGKMGSGGQTDAGQKAEKLVGQTVIDLVLQKRESS